jgi:8-oxo-dGTP pyrophosphatase MutT (NUDIX family)
MNSSAVDHFRVTGPRLGASDATAALLVLSDGRYLLQLRDQKPNIWYPGHWGCFGGAVDEGENSLEALRRELREEIGLESEVGALFTSFTFDFGFAGKEVYSRTYYEVTLPVGHLHTLVLSEGAGMKAFAPEDVLALPRVVPYDAFALWLHMIRGRL